MKIKPILPFFLYMVLIFTIEILTIEFTSPYFLAFTSIPSSTVFAIVLLLWVLLAWFIVPLINMRRYELHFVSDVHAGKSLSTWMTFFGTSKKSIYIYLFTAFLLWGIYSLTFLPVALSHSIFLLMRANPGITFAGTLKPLYRGVRLLISVVAPIAFALTAILLAADMLQSIRFLRAISDGNTCISGRTSPRIKNIELDSPIPRVTANGADQTVYVHFSDSNADVERLLIDVIRGRGFIDYSFNPAIQGLKEGIIEFSIRAPMPQVVELSLTLVDAAGNISCPRRLRLVFTEDYLDEPYGFLYRVKGSTGTSGLEISFSKDSRFMAVSDIDGGVVIWDVATGERLRRINSDCISTLCTTGSTLTSSISPDGMSLATGHDFGWLALWDMVTAKPTILRNVGDKVTALSFHPSQKSLAAYTTPKSWGSGEIRIWNLYTKTVSQVIDPTPQINVAVNSITEGYPADGALKPGDLIVAINGTRVKLVSQVVDLVSNSEGSDLIFSIIRDGESFEIPLTPIWDTSVERYVVGVSIYELFGVRGVFGAPPIHDLRFSGNGILLIFDLVDTVRVWDLSIRKEVAILEAGDALAQVTQGERGYIMDLTVAAETHKTSRVAAAYAGGYIAVWDVYSQSIVNEFLTSESLTSIALSPDGQSLVACNGNLVAWDIESGVSIIKPDVKINCRNVTFSPNGRILATSYALTVELWDAQKLLGR